jgi:pyruvate/2-oxoglutarate dehydrogenase complex dihydrolipoamide acyltransferase (E2) component
VDVTNIVKWRNANKKKFQEQTGVKLTFTPIFIEAFIKAIGEFPLMNSSVDGDEYYREEGYQLRLGVALGEGGKGGLIVPVIKKAQDKNLIGIAKSVSDLATKARNKELSPDDLVGGTITLTNYGSVGNLMGTPNYQSAAGSDPWNRRDRKTTGCDGDRAGRCDCDSPSSCTSP